MRPTAKGERMDDFIRAQVLDLRRTPNVRLPRPADCQIVARIAPRSLAAHAGVGIRDLLVSLDGAAAAALPAIALRPAAERSWAFYSRARHELLELRATGIEPGVELRHTPDGIKERYRAGQSSPMDLDALWDARDWAALERLSAATLAARGRDRDTPALLFQGAALYETGRRAEGTRLVEEYLSRHASHWTVNFAAVGLYYMALARLDSGDRAKGLEILQAAFERDRRPRLADALEKHTGVRPLLENPRWLGKLFPADYRLPRIGAPGSLDLRPALATLAEGQLLGVCLLASYRGNGPYDELMWRYHNFATWFARFLPAFHVITRVPERPADYPHYFRGEDRVRADGLPFALALESGEVGAAVRPEESPFVLLLDRNGTVRYEGELGAVDLWNVIAALHGGASRA